MVMICIANERRSKILVMICAANERRSEILVMLCKANERRSEMLAIINLVYLVMAPRKDLRCLFFSVLINNSFSTKKVDTLGKEINVVCSKILQ
jgi:hypothetical protein